MTTNYANATNYLAIRICVISEIRSHRKFQVQCSNLNVSSSYHKVQCSKFNVQSFVFLVKKILVK